MRKTNYICDICNKDIKSHKRTVKGNLGFEKTKDCYFTVIFKEFTHTPYGTNDITYEKSVDLCDDCYQAVHTLLHNIKTNATESPVKKYIDPNDMLENQMNLFNDI